MSTWLALLDQEDGQLCAPVTGHASGRRWLCGWDSAERPHNRALQVSPDLVGNGPACQISLLLLASSARPIADDPAVVQSRRAILRDVRFGGSSLLTADPVHIAGSVVVARADRPEQVHALLDDPFRQFGRPLLLGVAAGLLTPHPPALGPVVERYGGKPWPYDHW